MILAAILLQHVAVPGLPESVVIPAPPPRMRHTIAPRTAIRAFQEICVANLRDRGEVAKAAHRAGFRSDPDSRPELGADSYVRGDTNLQYNLTGMPPASVHQPQCFIRAWLDANVGEAGFERLFTAAVRPGTLRKSKPVLVWERDAGGGRTELIGLSLSRLPHGQIVAALSINLRSEAPGGH